MMELCLHNTEHESNICKNVVTFLEKEKYSDITFICKGGKKLRAHKLRLSCDSPFMKRLFAERDGYDDMTFVLLPDISHSILKLVLDFLYEGTMKLSESELKEFKEILILLDIKCPEALVDERPVQVIPTRPAPPVAKLDRAHKIQFNQQTKVLSMNAGIIEKRLAAEVIVNTQGKANLNSRHVTNDEEDLRSISREIDCDPLDVPDCYFPAPPSGSAVQNTSGTVSAEVRRGGSSFPNSSDNSKAYNENNNTKKRSRIKKQVENLVSQEKSIASNSASTQGNKPGRKRKTSNDITLLSSESILNSADLSAKRTRKSRTKNI